MSNNRTNISRVIFGRNIDRMDDVANCLKDKTKFLALVGSMGRGWQESEPLVAIRHTIDAADAEDYTTTLEEVAGILDKWASDAKPGSKVAFGEVKVSLADMAAAVRRYKVTKGTEGAVTVAGMRRTLAYLVAKAIFAGLPDEVPCMLHDALTTEEADAIAVAENRAKGVGTQKVDPKAVVAQIMSHLGTGLKDADIGRLMGYSDAERYQWQRALAAARFVKAGIFTLDEIEGLFKNLTNVSWTKYEKLTSENQRQEHVEAIRKGKKGKTPTASGGVMKAIEENPVTFAAEMAKAYGAGDEAVQALGTALAKADAKQQTLFNELYAAFRAGLDLTPAVEAMNKAGKRKSA